MIFSPLRHFLFIAVTIRYLLRCHIDRSTISPQHIHARSAAVFYTRCCLRVILLMLRDMARCACQLFFDAATTCYGYMLTTMMLPLFRAYYITLLLLITMLIILRGFFDFSLSPIFFTPQRHVLTLLLIMLMRHMI